MQCPICKLDTSTTFEAMHGYSLCKCSNCNLVWDQHPPIHPTEQYTKDYFINQNAKGGYANYFEGMTINKKTFAERLLAINKHTGFKSKLLDIGCALGDFLVMAQELNWTDIEGLEVSDYACTFAKNRGLNVKKGYFEKIYYPGNHFNVVTMQDVIEHVQNPLAHLTKIYKILKPSGWIYIVTPNIDSNWSKLLGTFWYHYKPGEHILYFSPKSINYALKQAGFTNIQTKSTYHTMSLGYILNRLRYYSPGFFTLLYKIIKKTPFHDITLKLNTGEIEAWGQKP